MHGYQSRDLTHLDTDAARMLKHSEGRAYYGIGRPFVGDPVLELDGEVIDAINYADEALRQGYNMGGIPAILRGLRDEVVKIHREGVREEMKTAV